MSEILIQRIYEPAAASDGFRALVDRLWPRGVSRQRAALDAWWKDLAPSPALRTEWHHDPSRFDAFAEAYRAELGGREFVTEALEIIRSHERVTLLYAAHDPQVNHAVVLRDYLASRL